MKRIIINGLCSIGFLLLFSNCNDLLDFYPESEMSDAIFWNTPNDFKTASGQLYNDISHPWISADIDADILGYDAGSFTTGRMLGDIQVPSSDGWNDIYKKIRTINYLLEKAGTYPNPSDIKSCVAEAYFFRAWHYYDLYKKYGSVPLIKKVLDVNSPELLIPRESNENTINFILDDIDKAITDLPIQKDISANDKGRVSKEAALSFKARVCLNEATWRKYHSSGEYTSLLDKAITASDEVINSGHFAIFNHPDQLGEQSYKYLFILENLKCNPSNLTKKDNNEYIFFKIHDEKYGVLQEGLTNRWENPTRKFMDMFVCKNGLPITYNNQTNPQYLGYKAYRSSELINRDLRLTTIVRRDSVVYYFDPNKELWGNPNPPTTLYHASISSQTATGYISDKFGSERYGSNGNRGYCIDYPLIRYAEVLLIYAEAKIEKDGQISNADLNKSINLLRERGGVSPLTNELLVGTGLNMRDEIRRERTCELYKEGFRLYDLKRWKIVKEAMTEDILGMYLAKDGPWSNQLNKNETLPLAANGFHVLTDKSKRQWNDHFDYDPIAYDQLKLNPNLKQNDGYPDGR